MIKWVRRKLGIVSPSQRAREVGQAWADGLVAGLTATPKTPTTWEQFLAGLSRFDNLLEWARRTVDRVWWGLDD